MILLTEMLIAFCFQVIMLFVLFTCFEIAPEILDGGEVTENPNISIRDEIADITELSNLL